MKGQNKPIKNIKQFFNRAIKKLMHSGNEEYKEKVEKVTSKFQDYIPPKSKPAKRKRHPTRCRVPMDPPKPNPAKARHKSATMPHFHMPNVRGMFCKAPTQDQVRRLEKRIGLKVKVREGECYVGASQFKVPVNATLEEAQALLDAYLA